MENQNEKERQININPAVPPILYTDNIVWTIGQDGIVLTIMQSLLGTNQMQIVARIGMSRDHMKRVLNMLEKDLALTEAQGQSGKKR